MTDFQIIWFSVWAGLFVVSVFLWLGTEELYPVIVVFACLALSIPALGIEHVLSQ